MGDLLHPHNVTRDGQTGRLSVYQQQFRPGVAVLFVSSVVDVEEFADMKSSVPCVEVEAGSGIRAWEISVDGRPSLAVMAAGSDKVTIFKA